MRTAATSASAASATGYTNLPQVSQPIEETVDLVTFEAERP
jgi:hypothetical protein